MTRTRLFTHVRLRVVLRWIPRAAIVRVLVTVPRRPQHGIACMHDGRVVAIARIDDAFVPASAYAFCVEVDCVAAASVRCCTHVLVYVSTWRPRAGAAQTYVDASMPCTPQE